ncbi:MAG TPA: serine/threonine-protein kinase [Allocoleopsis sp.]
MRVATGSTSVLGASQMSWSSGQNIKGGRYTIEKKLGEGGFGITYLARHKNNKYVVIKSLNGDMQRRPDFHELQQDFINEALRLAKCSHPHIVQIHEVLQEGMLWCMVMEYINEESLYHRIASQGILSEVEALHYIWQIGNALTVVHKRGLLHRDVKPPNIMLRPAAKNYYDAVLIDFGIAREFTPNLTQTHTQALSHGFAPIEQYEEKAKRGAYTDIYALAATLYFILTKEVPISARSRFDGASLKSPRAINPSISLKIERAILRGMALQPQERPQSVREWLEMLDYKHKNIREEWNKWSSRTLKVFSEGLGIPILKKSKKQNKNYEGIQELNLVFSLVYFACSCIFHTLAFGALLSVQFNGNVRFILLAINLAILILIFFLTKAKDYKTTILIFIALFILVVINGILPLVDNEQTYSLSRKEIESLGIGNIFAYIWFILYQCFSPIFRSSKHVFFCGVLIYSLFICLGWIFNTSIIKLIHSILSLPLI